MVRDFLIWMDDVEWEIREVGLEDYTKLKWPGIDAFANIRVKEGKLAYVHDISLRDEDIKRVKKEKLFSEICNFTHNDTKFLKNIAQKDGKKFQGTFIEALEYIKEVFYG